MDAWEAAVTGRAPGVVRVGLAVPLSGPLAMTAPSALGLATLAAGELTDAGGVRGRPLELVTVDAGRRPAEVGADVAALQAAGAVDAVVGFSTSDVSRAVAAVLAGRTPYVFTPPHEGGRGTRGALRIGSSPPVQHAAALAWLVRHRRARRWVLLGTDYVWPQAVHHAARAVLRDLGADVVGELLVPFGPADPGPALDLVRRTRADAVLLSLVGRDLVAFNRAFGRAGLGRRVVRLSGALEENGLYAIGGDDTGELYACMPSFAAAASDAADEGQLALQERLAAHAGPDAPVVCAYARGVHDGVRTAAALLDDRTPARPRPPRARLARADGLVFREVGHPA
ncbi:amino acid/amide ABC transporter substrate-binding protein, HAAT family (TC 3.A.1.4.-) [Geodermatophilus telluris]|uniref:Amino acid/amide ABC transporter substrate-binding protein, HAAT family (TC 3.A.1.4.-) n=2 Tax=Geodermatophilus telluris TaxID=1190417 RepID=A0A1G6QCA0_9ACTN|nr:amino acid/amide ABC transporter substrate-binding protein, HAAT family (TC 3.A.1.4.-) [Geodermatophilus telluris]